MKLGVDMGGNKELNHDSHNQVNIPYFPII